MKDLEKDKIELRSRLKRAIAIGIVVLIVVFYSLLSGILEALMILMLTMILLATPWVILYIDYCLLKLKIEIMKELTKENETNK
jgi:Ca2+/Na+ antiporter